MGWLGNKVLAWSEGVQTRELQQFNNRLGAMDSQEIALIVALATDRRHKLHEMYGWNLLEPAQLMTVEVRAAIKLNSLIRQLQKDGNPAVAAGLMVWLHTLRAAPSLDLRIHGRNLWRQLARGFPYVYDAEEGMTMLGGQSLNLDGYDEFPSGLSPEPI